MKIKVCGLNNADNIAAVTAMQPDYAGFIFYAKSPRYAGALVAGSLALVPSAVIKTAVFVNETETEIDRLIARYNFGAIQLHGNESANFCAAFKGRVQVLKAFGINEGFDFDTLIPYQRKVDYFLFDTKTEGHGGSGQTFNWHILNQYRLNTPFFLSGGLSMDNLPEINKIKHPQFYGVDLNSRFETAPGIKDIKKLLTAFELLRP